MQVVVAGGALRRFDVAATRQTFRKVTISDELTELTHKVSASVGCCCLCCCSCLLSTALFRVTLSVVGTMG